MLTFISYFFYKSAYNNSEDNKSRLKASSTNVALWRHPSEIEEHVVG